MARPLRLEFAGALYHVTARGDRREDIYEADEDFSIFLSVLGDVCEQYNWVVHAYCLMTNHYHLLIETPDANLSKGMRQLNGVYTQRFNQKYTRVGHVFQGRYKAILVEKESYLLELARYIVLSPVRAHMVHSVVEWPWSSYRASTSQCEKPVWLNTEWILANFSKNKGEAIERYRRFVQEGKGQPSPWAFLKNQLYLGGEKFVEKMVDKIEQNKELSEIPSGQRRKLANSLRWYESQSGSRDEAIFSAYLSGAFSMKEIGLYFGLHYSRVSRIISRAKDKT